MFIAPFTRLTTLDMSDASRLGAKEAARQAALLRVPGQPDRQGAVREGEMVSHSYRPVEIADSDRAE